MLGQDERFGVEVLTEDGVGEHLVLDFKVVLESGRALGFLLLDELGDGHHFVLVKFLVHFVYVLVDHLNELSLSTLNLLLFSSLLFIKD